MREKAPASRRFFWTAAKATRSLFAVCSYPYAARAKTPRSEEGAFAPERSASATENFFWFFELQVFEF